MIPKLNTIEKHTVIEIVKLLKLKYGRTRIEELEELMEDWIKFNFNEHESEEEYLFAMEKRIADERMTVASSIMWKSKQIERVCHSSKDAETLAMSKLLDEVTYIARQVEILLFGDYRKRLPVRVMTDSEPTLESIASTRQIERKGLRMTVQEMKEKLMEGEITSYQWLSTKEMWADGLTKEMEMAEGLRNLLKEGKCKITGQEINKVVCQNEEIRMLNIRNRKKNEETKEKKETRGSCTSSVQKCRKE